MNGKQDQLRHFGSPTRSREEQPLERRTLFHQRSQPLFKPLLSLNPSWNLSRLLTSPPFRMRHPLSPLLPTQLLLTLQRPDPPPPPATPPPSQLPLSSFTPLLFVPLSKRSSPLSLQSPSKDLASRPPHPTRDLSNSPLSLLVSSLLRSLPLSPKSKLKPDRASRLRLWV